MSEAEPKSILTTIQKRRIEAATSIRSERAKQIDYLHTIQCQTSLPYRDPGDDVREWDRKQGNASLRIEAGSALDPRTNEYVKLGLPFGEKPRLVLIHLASEAIRTKSPIIDVEGSMTAFARSLGLETNGHHLRGLKDQIGRLASSTIRMGMVEQGRMVQVNTQVASAFDLWYPDEESQRVLWPSTVRLSHEFFESLSRHAIPLDNRAVGAIANSPIALDAYVWLSQRLHRISPDKPQFIAWANIYEQFGQGYARIRDFRKKFLLTLHQIRAVYPDSRIETDEKGMTEASRTTLAICLSCRLDSAFGNQYMNERNTRANTFGNPILEPFKGLLLCVQKKPIGGDFQQHFLPGLKPDLSATDSGNDQSPFVV